ncbi:MAG: hypothetical protein CML47_01320 [Rhodobacteraceae bacterium]|nr:MAG: hypothetical protein CML47_01320 [Paracoccaceae bacterium]|tara:strand:- start:759 stop:1583 length:825 start_codon:yes stop_codon:yes gene_type:complete
MNSIFGNAIVSVDCELLLKYYSITGYAGKNMICSAKIVSQPSAGGVLCYESCFSQVKTNTNGQYVLPLCAYGSDAANALHRGQLIWIEAQACDGCVMRAVCEYNNKIEIVNVTVLSTIKCNMIEILMEKINIEKIKEIKKTVEEIVVRSLCPACARGGVEDDINILCEIIRLGGICENSNIILYCFAETILEVVGKVDFGNELIIEKIFDKCCVKCGCDKLKQKIREKSRKASTLIMLNRKKNFGIFDVTRRLFMDYSFNFTEDDIHNKIGQHN